MLPRDISPAMLPRADAADFRLMLLSPALLMMFRHYVFADYALSLLMLLRFRCLFFFRALFRCFMMLMMLSITDAACRRRLMFTLFCRRC